MTGWGSLRRILSTRFSSMKALVGGGTQRKQRTGMTVRRTRASIARHKIRTSREDFLLFTTDACILDEPVRKTREAAALLGADRTLLPAQGRVKMKGGEVEEESG